MTEAGPLVTAMYDELRRLAGLQLDRQPGLQTLQATALVNEAYVKLAARPDLAVANREEFLRLACGVMRNVLVDRARARGAAKRGGGWKRITLNAALEDGPAHEIDVLALNEAVDELGAMNERLGRLVELRFFGGLSEEEAAGLMGLSRAAATRDWRMARAWLSTRLREEEGPG